MQTDRGADIMDGVGATRFVVRFGGVSIDSQCSVPEAPQDFSTNDGSGKE